MELDLLKVKEKIRISIARCKEDLKKNSDNLYFHATLVNKGMIAAYEEVLFYLENIKDSD